MPNVPGLSAGGGIEAVSCLNTPKIDKRTALSY